MVEWAVVEWGDRVALWQERDRLDGDGCPFYAVVSAPAVPDRPREWQKPYELLYVGLAFRQTAHQRMKQGHPSYERVIAHILEHKHERQVLVMLGRLIARSPERVTQEFVEDIEAVLIYENRPKFNTRNRSTYNGRPLVVVRHPSQPDEQPGDEPIMHLSASSQSAFTRWNNGRGHKDMRRKLAKIGR